MNTWKTHTKLRISSTNNRSIKFKGTVHYQDIKLKTDNKTKTQNSTTSRWKPKGKTICPIHICGWYIKHPRRKITRRNIKILNTIFVRLFITFKYLIDHYHCMFMNRNSWKFYFSVTTQPI